ncbi:aminoacyl-tRNA deacylase [Lacisediminihabitans changchengi]|uniref:YbaK/EbsC family protein n=1 Tax=Lacisediminihabitans changchengi TaxID=2787634 RepID=A0A934W3L7_9MICO|nr:YbaK/EbsC family protein [Lacisediminihabitans changchengi]MBK4346620.1 YbaK/EbsC family protein [Lacisediminihabitans changchengi]
MTEPLTGTARVEADAAARGLAIEIVERPPADSLEHAAELLGLTPREIIKSLVVRKHTPEGAPSEYLFALVPGDRQISWAKLRALVGVNKLSLPSPELALEATGYARGTITPLGAYGDWPVYADASITGSRIALGAGAHGYSAFVDADSFIAAFHATVADIS